MKGENAMKRRNTYLLIAFIFVLSIAVSTMTLYLPYLLSDFINFFSKGKDCFAIIVDYTIVSIALFPLSIILKYCLETLSWNYINNLRAKMLKKIIIIDYSFFQAYSSGDLIEYYEVDIKKVYMLLSNTLPRLILNCFVICTILCIFLLNSVYLFLFFLIYILLNLYVTKKFSKRNQNVVLEESKYHEEMTSIYGQWLDMKSTLFSLGSTKNIVNRFTSWQDNWLKYRVNSNKFFYSIWCITMLLNAFADLFILLISGLLFLSGVINIGMIYLYYNYSKKIQAPLESLQQQFQACIRGWNSIKRINRILNYKANSQEGDVEFKEIIKRIDIVNLSFSYDTKNNVINNLKVYFECGKVYAIFGTSGDGKSSLCKIMAKLLPYEIGNIIINGKEMLRIRKNDYYDQIAYITNEPFIINDTLNNNLTLHHEKYTRNEVNDILMINGIYDLFSFELDDEDVLNTNINVSELSNGQKQIIALVRLLFIKKSLILIDEGMSDIDEATTEILFQKLTHQNKDAIILNVSHNIVDHSFYDKVYMMKEGVLYEEKYN